MGSDCGYEVTGENPDEVKSKMMDHAMSEHVDMMGSMTEGEKEDMMRKMDEKMMMV